MKKNNLDAFKAKANSVLMSEALLNISGGQQDPDYCHKVSVVMLYGKGKSAMGYSQEQIDRFFTNPQWAQQFDSMYNPEDPNAADQREMFFDQVVSTF